MINALDPDHMTAAERLDEIGDILATGVLRLYRRQGTIKTTNEINELREFPLDFPGARSVHGLEPEPTGENHEHA